MNARLTIALLLALAAIVAAAYWALGPREHRGLEEVVGTEKSDAPMPVTLQKSRSRSSSDRDVPDDEPRMVEPRAHPERDAGLEVATADAGKPAVETEWDDPTNARVLGRKTWMAPVDTAEEARVDQIFEESRAARYDPRLPNVSRAASIVAAREVVDRCFDALASRQPGIQGRLIVAWTAGAADGRGRITDPRINVNYKLADPTFESCVLDGLNGRAFQGPDGDSIQVEAPFFYDGSY